MKNILYCGNAQADIADFPKKAKIRIAHLLERLAENLELSPNDFKYMPSVGSGVYELRIKAEQQYRVFYVAKFSEAIYVLHAFVKKTQQTAQRDLEKGKQRYKALLKIIR